MSKIIQALVICTPLLHGTSFAQNLDELRSASDQQGKWTISLSAVASNAAIKIIDSEVALPEELAESDIEVILSDDLSVSSTVVSSSVGYRILPLAEVFVRGGLIASDTETGVTITGTPNGPFSDVFDGPITIDGEADMDLEGYSIGLGANAILPILSFENNTLAAYSSFQFIRNEFDDAVSSEGAITSFGLIYPLNIEEDKIIYRVGGSYNWITRNIEQSLILNGESVRVSVTQEFKDPWAVEAGVGIPVASNTLLGLGVWHQFSGETSALVSLTYRFD